MKKFLFVFSVLVFLLCLTLFIINMIGANDWLAFVVAVLGMISASLTIWISKMLIQLKE